MDIQLYSFFLHKNNWQQTVPLQKKKNYRKHIQTHMYIKYITNR
jgi:hypothetical protein